MELRERRLSVGGQCGRDGARESRGVGQAQGAGRVGGGGEGVRRRAWRPRRTMVDGVRVVGVEEVSTGTRGE